jgi:cytochrome c553
MRGLLVYCATMAGILLASGVLAQDVQRGEELYEVCVACHGRDGAGIVELRAPPIAGLSQDYVVRQLESFRDGARGENGSAFSNLMRMIALSLGEQDVADVAAYVSALEQPPAPEPVQGIAERGQNRYDTLCYACHGSNGEGNALVEAPRLAGLSDQYLLEQLAAFRNGKRGTHPDDLFGAQMRIMALALRDEQDVRDVVAYIATLDAPPAQPTLSNGDVERGAATFNLCAACHGESGQGAPILRTPLLAGQHDWYLLRQLEAYRADVRGVHASDTYGRQMRQIALSLEDQQALADVVAYISRMETE